MRRRLEPTDKRAAQIGIKVKQETKDKLIFISEREIHPLSTQINIILESYIKNYFEANKLNWEEYTHKGE